MSQVLKISENGHHSAESNGNGLGRRGGGVTGDVGSESMRRGEQLVAVTVAALAVVIVRNGSEQRFSVGPFTRGHEAHRRLRAGDTLVVVTDTRANGQTEVELPDCGCRAMIWRD